MAERDHDGARPRHQLLHQHQPGSAAAFRWSVLLNALLSGLQLAIGAAFGSLALIGDALHNLGDVAGLLFGWGAERLSTRPTSEQFTYGYGRSTELAALANALLIGTAGLVVVVEALQRLAHPLPVLAGPVAWAAAAGVLVNLLSALAFGSEHQHDLNRRAAVLHLLTDAAVSAAVLVSALLVMVTRWAWLDSLTALVVGLAVAWTGWDLLRESARLSLDAVPRGIDLAAVTRCLQALPGVVDVHHLHVWAISTSQTALTVHLRRRPTLPDMVLLHRAKQQLAALGIVHSTIQLEPPEGLEDQTP
jgi:cobalt-zinc-cadmium efflux system protein